MTNDTKARALLAAEWEREGRPDLAASIRKGKYTEWNKAGPAVRAISAALAEGEKEREGVEAERDEARNIVRDIHWMARRYADGRQSYAVGMFNDAVKRAYDGGWLQHTMTAEEPFARDGMFSSEWKSIEARLRDAEGEVARLREALEPFARVLDESVPEDQAKPTVGDYRRARAALSADEATDGWQDISTAPKDGEMGDA
jgi:hypothetical protein